MEHRLDELTSLVRQLAMSQHHPPSQEMPVARVCGICACNSHPTDACPTLQEESTDLSSVAAVGSFPGKPGFQQHHSQYNPYSSMYNLGWRDHPNLRYGSGTPPGF